MDRQKQCHSEVSKYSLAYGTASYFLPLKSPLVVDYLIFPPVKRMAHICRRLLSSWSNIVSSLPSFWMGQSTENKEACALALPPENPLANWKKTGCDMRNRWICEMRTLIKWSAVLLKWRRIYPSVLLFKPIYPVGLLLLFTFLQLKLLADLFIALTPNVPKFLNIVMWDILVL